MATISANPRPNLKIRSSEIVNTSWNDSDNVDKISLSDGTYKLTKQLSEGNLELCYRFSPLFRVSGENIVTSKLMVVAGFASPIHIDEIVKGRSETVMAMAKAVLSIARDEHADITADEVPWLNDAIKKIYGFGRALRDDWDCGRNRPVAYYS